MSALSKSTTVIHVYTIGFTKTSARDFFGRLRDADVRGVVDVRLSNMSQLAGFTKKSDLEYFLDSILHVPYRHLPSLAPTQDLLDAYKKRKGDWAEYERHFLDLLRQRRVELTLSPGELERWCLLCSEPTADRCHRRLVAEHLQRCWRDVEITHL
jgi:uncharacterized protein (DUF488 family)